MSQRIETQGHAALPDTEPMNETERIRHQLTQEEAEEHTDAYSPTMSDAEIEAFIARQHQQANVWAKEQTVPTDSVPVIRRMRAQRTRQLMRRSGDARRG